MAAWALLPLMAAAPQPAGAYVLEGPHILDFTADAMGPIAALQAQQQLLVYPETPRSALTAPDDARAAPEEAQAVLDETVIYVMPERFRSDIESERIRRTHLEFGDSSLTVIDDRLTVGANPFDRYQRLLRSRTRPRLMQTLNQLGVETAISSLGRLEEKVVYVIGARYPDESISQLAVDKETFLPVRLLLVDADAPAGGGRLEFFYLDWQKVQSGRFPYQVRFYTNGRLAREIRVADLRLNPSIPAALMDLEALKASVAQHQADTPQGQKQEAVEAMQRAVHEFRKKFE